MGVYIDPPTPPQSHLRTTDVFKAALHAAFADLFNDGFVANLVELGHLLHAVGPRT